MEKTVLRVGRFLTAEAEDRGAMEVTISGGRICRLASHQQNPAAPSLPLVVDRTDCTLMPLLADAHIHLALSDGITDSASFHTRERLDVELAEYLRFGIGSVLSLGTDQSWVAEVCEARRTDPVPGLAAPYTAGIGFGAFGGWPSEFTTPETRFRPVEPAAARKQVRRLSKDGIRFVKLWVDDLAGTMPKISTPISTAIIEEAHTYGMKVFAHVFTHEDAEQLVSAGVDALAHSIRDREIMEELCDTMARQGVSLIPTLVREENSLNFGSPENPYLRDTLFQRCAGSRLHEFGRIALRIDRENHPPKQQSQSIMEIAFSNLGRAFRAGVTICLGTDAGFQHKLPGFSEVRELELMQHSGLSSKAALQSGLEHNYRLFASLASRVQVGDAADFMLVEGNPLTSISTLRNVWEVWQGGRPITRTETSQTRDFV